MYFNFMAAITSALSLEPKRIKSVTNACVPLIPDSFLFFFFFCLSFWGAYWLCVSTITLKQ